MNKINITNKMKFNAQFWIKISIINLLIVTSLGVLMRYKIGYDFPYLSQKNIQHAHSHFAFLGWVTHTIYSLIIYYITEKIEQNNLKKYNKLLIFNLVCSYGMLISFFVSGYSFVSISFATLSIINNAIIMYYMFDDFKKLKEYHPSIQWFKSAMWFNLISSVGTFYLAYIMASKNFNEHWYLAAIYFYLHFQYNGFFTFSCMGFAVNKLPLYLPSYKFNKIIYKVFFYTCIPAYFLSILWAKIPIWLYVITIIAAIAQVVIWFKFIIDVKSALKGGNSFSNFARILFIFVSVAFTIKILLQLGSTIPEISKLAFGFRPVVIAYLHLVLLAVISVYLLAYSYKTKLLINNKKTVTALTIFIVGVFLNELVLGVQGIASFMYFPIKHINDMLFIVSLIILSGMILLLISQKKQKHSLSN
jgi:hypothetical protein